MLLKTSKSVYVQFYYCFVAKRFKLVEALSMQLTVELSSAELRKEWLSEPPDLERRREIKAKASRLLVAEFPYPDWPGVHTGLSLGSNTTASFLFSLRSPRGTKPQRIDVIAEDSPQSTAFLHGVVGDLEIFNGHGLSRLGFFYKCPEASEAEGFFTDSAEFPLDRVEIFQLHSVIS